MIAHGCSQVSVNQEAMRLDEAQFVTFAQTVGYPKA